MLARILWPFRKHRLGFRRPYILVYAAWLFGFLQWGNRTFTTSLVLFLVGLTDNLFVRKDALVNEVKSPFCFVILTFVRMPKITWRIRTMSTDVVFCTVLDVSFQKGCGLWVFCLSKNIFSVVWNLRIRSRRGRLCCFSTLILIVAETASVFFCALSFWFPLIAFSLLPSSADRFPVSTRFQRNSFQFFRFWPQSFTSAHLIQTFQNSVMGNLTDW